MPRDVFLCLDVGDVRIGAAISRSGVIAEPLTTIERQSKRQTLDALEELVNREKVTVCVLGLPYLEGGAEGEQAEKTRSFGRSLARRLPGLQIDFWDERYSSAEARDHAGRRAGPGAEKGLIDRLAAAFILQSYLDDRNERRHSDTTQGEK